MTKARYTETKYSPCPEGTHVAVCCDEVDRGLVDTPFGTKRYEVRFVFQIADVDPETNRRYLAFATYHNTLHPSSNLRKVLETWNGRPFASEEDAKNVDFEDYVGRGALISVSHKITSIGRTFASIDAVRPLPPKTKGLLPQYTQAGSDGDVAADIAEAETDQTAQRRRARARHAHARSCGSPSVLARGRRCRDGPGLGRHHS